MGGRPLTALAIAAFPKEGLESETIRAIFRGGFDKLREAGVSLLGGHTVQDQEIKFGYAVTGAIEPSRILTNAGAKPGDVLFLTKPIGTGIVGTAIKFDRAPAALLEEAVAAMRTLNRAAADALRSLPAGSVHACTDITGFGLAGHGTGMARASGVTLDLIYAAVPRFSGLDAVVRDNLSGGFWSNREHFGSGVEVQSADRPAEADAVAAVLYDPQTSGGLLAAVAPSAADSATAAFAAAGVAAAKIGVVAPPEPGVHIRVRTRP